MKRKTGRRKDPIWKHAKEEQNGFICRYCEKFYTGGASRIKSHLSGKSGGGISCCPVYATVRAEEAATLVTTTTSSQQRPHNNNTIILQSAPSSLHLFDESRGGINPCPIFATFDVDQEVVNFINSDTSSPERQHNSNRTFSLGASSSTRESIDEVHMLLVKHFILNNIPLETTEKPHFRNLVSSIASLGPWYELPLTCLNLLVNLHKEVEQYMMTVRDSWSITGCTVKLHVKRRTYEDFFKQYDVVGYTVYCPKGVIFLDAHDPSYDPSISLSSFQQLLYVTEKAIKQEAIQILYDVEEDEDSHQNLLLYASSMLYSMKYCFKCMTTICPTKHILELLQRMHNSCTWLFDFLMDVNYVYQYLTRAKSESLAMRRAENPSLSKYTNPFSELIIVMQCKAELQSTFRNQSENASILSYIITQDKFWEDGKMVLDAVGPFIRILEVFDTFVPNIGYFFEAVEIAESRINHYYRLEKEKFEELSISFNTLKGFMVNFMHVAAAYLNPDYMLNKLSKSSIDIQEGIDYMNDCLVKSEKDKFTKQLEIYSNKDPSLFTETAISKLKVYHPVTWWDEFGDVVPVLRRYAIQLLSQPSNCLSHLCHKDKFEGSDLFQKNVKMMEEFKLLRETVLTPIDLSVIGAPLC